MTKKITADQIRKLRDETGAPVMRVKKVLEELKGDEKKALKILKKEGFEKAAKRVERETKAGKLFVYTHHNEKVVGVVELLCETDFVARNELFSNLGKSLAMQVASMGDKKLLKQDFIKDPSKKIEVLIKEVIAKTGENIKAGRIWRIVLGEHAIE
ncbi:elongation factor Ts [Patescibacteria group bacterium]